ncbi:MAG: M1 family aminopeptidase [Bacteroidota bacterium]|nr:M1 family aminopeptidase [Bacteroidota bacterium]MDP4229703.1 M1 family aminopeptidase [Bacteroidota bacterium]MDP4237312.1 M1 family aminopeptidase [Bacteroidota bacterium]
MKLQLTFVLLICFFLANTTFGHDGLKCSRASVSTAAPLWPTEPHRPYDVLKYRLTLDWRKVFETQSQQFSGVNIIDLKLTSETPNVTLDAGLMKIDSVSVSGVPILPVPQPTSGEELIIPLPASLQKSGEQLTVTIGYHRDTLINQGIYFYPKGSYDPYQKTNTTEDIAYTMSEPIDAHYWMPCMDRPYDKAESEISIIAPNGIETASNGTLLSKEAYTPTSTIWHWKSDEPITTYLMVADASTFIHWSETHHRTAAAADTVHLDFYAWPSDYYQDSITDGSTYNAKFFLRNTSSIMSWFEAHYGGFPFVKYGQVPVQPFAFGGMEHQTITSIHRGWLRGSDQGIAHEMAHQWFGDKTTCESFKDIWMNEGFATYSEALWGESQGGNDGYMNIMWQKRGSYLFGPAHDLPVYDPPADNVFNGALTYAKGGCVLHMLRRMLGNDTMFFGALRDYSNAFAYTTANTTQLQNYLSGRLGIDLAEFFDEWIFGRLHPQYDMTWAQSVGNRLVLQINQVQPDSIRDHFTMPVKFFAFHGGVPDTLTFVNNLRSQRFEKVLGYTIDSLVFDLDALILSEPTLTYSTALAVRSIDPPHSQFSVYREGGEVLCTFEETNSGGTIEIYNSLGMKMKSAAVLSGETSKVLDTHSLASGVYFVRYISGSVNEVRSVNIVR